LTQDDALFRFQKASDLARRGDWGLGCMSGHGGPPVHLLPLAPPGPALRVGHPASEGAAAATDAQLDQPVDRATRSRLLARSSHRWSAADLRRAQASQVGRVQDLAQRRPQGCYAVTGSTPRPSATSTSTIPVSWCSWTAFRSDGCRRQGHLLAIHRHRRLIGIHVGRAAPEP